MVNYTLLEIAMFYVYQFHDYWTTLLDSLLTKNPKHEQNLLIRSLTSRPLLLATYKFGLATVIPIISLFILHSLLPIYIDTIVEALVTVNNMIVLYRHKLDKIGKSSGKLSKLNNALSLGKGIPLIKP